MARNDALVKLHERLVRRRQELLSALNDDLGDLGQPSGGRSSDDPIDAASDAVTVEMTSKLAELESRELHQIDRAIMRLRQGKYGRCEGCDKKIQVARLNALPYTTVCITCQRQREENPDADDTSANWHQVYETEVAAKEVTSVNLADFEYHTR